MNRQEQFDLIKKYFLERDLDLYAGGNLPVRSTEQGIWGPSVLDYCYDAFLKLHLENFRHFVDLGSGDGRIVWIASLFTEASGIESDKEFHAIAKKARPFDPVHNVHLLCKDFRNMKLNEFDFLFANPDHTYAPDFSRKLLEECSGATFLLYNNIFPVYDFKKERVLWYDQFPLTVYKVVPSRG